MALGRSHLPPTKQSLPTAQLIKPRLAVAAANTYTCDFPTQLADSLGKAAKLRSLYDIGESNPVPASGL